MRIFLLPLAGALSMISVGVTLAQEAASPGAENQRQQEAATPPDYKDDRTTGAALVESYFNAIARKEYNRAWSYFDSDKPSKTFEDFVAGFKGTRDIEIEIGKPEEEGAAGSVYTNVPVAIRSVDDKGQEKVFTGCYTARSVNPQMQEEPDFNPGHLTSAKLGPSDAAFLASVPASCEGKERLSEEQLWLLRAQRVFDAERRATCSFYDREAVPAGNEPKAYTIEYNFSHDEQDMPRRKGFVLEFPCSLGAYNLGQTYYFATETDGIKPLHFAVPELDIRYENEEDPKDVDSMRIIGYNTVSELINASFDPRTMTFESFSKWRSVGDASSNGRWAFRNGEFSLIYFEVDASFDGEINPQDVLNFDAGP
ncbi:DUF1176 domain-containing protein [Limoniibacter endophyticus]|uniref:DUF1176 domain-containing protein n=1 Tax=Limoniibacter endophyticus TaxID=1565040 RepID=A0A8J3GGS2_9HYPH|nr:DUF1176 domain-containing protein [Limoniibacter endophyticus]GHC61854.1 hypothetical protein GCM10010136_02700 [Limoniibacter endophyticus]